VSKFQEVQPIKVIPFEVDSGANSLGNLHPLRRYNFSQSM